MLWDEYMTAIADRMREPDAATLAARIRVDLPYVVRPELEQVLVMSLNQVLREVEPSDWQAVSSAAVKIVTGGTVGTDYRTLDLDPATIRVLTLKVDGQPAVFASAASFVQSIYAGSRYTSAVAAMGRMLCFKGTTLTATVLIEPTLAAWKTAGEPILPADYDIRVIDVATKRILLSDYMPEFRA